MTLAFGRSVLFGAGEWHDWLIPLWLVAVGAAAASGLMLGFYGLLRLLAPKIAAMAHTTAKEAWHQPLFWVEIALGAVAILLFPFLPYYTFGEDIKMVKDSGLTVIMLLSMLLAVWSASVSIADELEGRTALTLLSKPIGRPQFILGKFMGILAPVFMMFVVLGSLFLATVSYKVTYDARESSNLTPEWAQCQAEMLQIVPGLVLAFFEAVVMVSISVAISTRLPMLPNLLICFAIYVLGHLVPQLVQSSLGKFAIVTFVGRFLATVLPVLEYFNVQPAVATGAEIPLAYVGLAFAYCAVYSTVAMLVALLLFEDRDLA